MRLQPSLVRFMTIPVVTATSNHGRFPISKIILNLGYVKLDDLPKFCADYFATLGNDSVFFEPPHFVEPPPKIMPYLMTMMDLH